MRRPQHPQNLFHAPAEPGARHSVAGLSVEARLAALEESVRMAAKPGAAAGNGYTITSDTTQAGGVKWLRDGTFIGSVTKTASFSATVASGGTNAFGPAIALSVTGDSTHWMELELTGFAPYISAGSAGHFNLCIWEAGVSALAKQQFYVPAVGISAGGIHCRHMLAPFAGTKTIWIVVENATGGSSTFVVQAGGDYPTVMSATWAGTSGHS